VCLKGDLNQGRELNTGAAGVKQPGREELQAYTDYWDGEGAVNLSSSTAKLAPKRRAGG